MAAESANQLDRIEQALGSLAEKTSGMEKSVEKLAEKTSQTDKNVEDILEIVVSMKDYMEKNLLTKAELSGELDSLEKKLEKRMDIGFEEVNGKIDGLGRRIDNEVEHRAQIETRVRKVEEVVFPA